MVSLTVSILNSASPGPTTPTLTEAVSTLVSVLNTISPSPTGPTLMEAESRLFSVQNLPTAPSAPTPLSTPVTAEGTTAAVQSEKNKSHASLTSLGYPRWVKINASSPNRGENENIGIAVVNMGSASATIRFTAFDTLGKPIDGADITNPRSIISEPGKQRPVLDRDLFGPSLADGQRVGWLKLEGISDKTVGLFLIFNDSVTVLDGVDMTVRPSTSFVPSEIEEGGFIQIQITNPSADTAALAFELLKSDGTRRSENVITRDITEAASNRIAC